MAYYPKSASSFPQTNSEIEMEIQGSSPATTIQSSFASTSASASSSNATDPMVYDVFINHRGVDTKATFASPLYRRLLSHGFRAFLDEQELEAGFDFPSQIVHDIRAASVHVAVFSPRYTESTWCLNELLLMRESGCPIIPVFYKVSPAELRYGNLLHALEMKTNPDPETGMPRPRYDSATFKNWRNVLSIVADISGFDLEGKFHGDEIRILDEVVESVLKRVKKTTGHVAEYPTGLDEKVEDFEREVLKQPQHSGKVQVLGIVAMGGMGKTTLAVEFFNRKNSDVQKINGGAAAGTISPLLRAPGNPAATGHGKNERVSFKIRASQGGDQNGAGPDLSVTVNGVHMPNPFVMGSGPPGTNYTVMKRAFDEGWGAAIAKTRAVQCRSRTQRNDQNLAGGGRIPVFKLF